MKPVDCPLECDVLAAVLQGRWERADPALRDHAAACTVCSDTAAVAGMLEADREATRGRAHLPDSGRVWWLAQQRGRLDAARTANRPLRAAQALATACALAVAWAWLPPGEWYGQTAGEFGAWLGAMAAALAGQGMFAAALAAILILLPAAACLAMGRE